MTEEIHIYDSQNQDENTGQSQSSWITKSLWLVSSILSVLVLGYFSAFIPSRLKLLGLFACFLGFSASGLILYWQNMWSIRVTKFILPLSVILGMTCFSWSTFHSYQKFSNTLKQDFHSQNPTLLTPLKNRDKQSNKKTVKADNNNTAKTTLTEKEKVDAEIRQAMKEVLDSGKEDLKQSSSFSNYLKHRIISLGKWSSPWPTVFWIVEILLAGTVSCLFTQRFLAKSIPISARDE